MLALPGGQATLARDGADQQARTITYMPTSGATTAITRDYGPSGHKATEIENGTVRQHVYGTGLAPLLRVEGDGSLTYQAGMDTISVDAAGGTTVVHLVADLKRSTVAVLDAQGQPRQQVAYGTLGQSTSRQQSASVYATAAQLSSYEGLTVLQLGPDQWIDNRARVYFPLAGRFLALDAAGKALGYEARGNNWITRADYDGNIDFDVLMRAVIAAGIPLGVGEDHSNKSGHNFLSVVLQWLRRQGNNDFVICHEENLLITLEGELNHRLENNKFGEYILELYKIGRVRSLGNRTDMPIEGEERTEILKQIKRQNPFAELRVKDYAFKMAGSEYWKESIPKIIKFTRKKGLTLILFMGGGHFMEESRKNTGRRYYYHRQVGEQAKITYVHTIYDELRVSMLQPVSSFNIIKNYDMVGIFPPYIDELGPGFYKKSGVLKIKNQDLDYLAFSWWANVHHSPALKKLFSFSNHKVGNEKDDEDEKKNEDEDEKKNDGNNAIVKPYNPQNEGAKGKDGDGPFGVGKGMNDK